MTEEHKQKIKEGREKARAERIASGLPLRKTKAKISKKINDKYILVIDNTEETIFDFLPKIRKVLRSDHNYVLSDKLEKELVHKTYWQNLDWIKEKLSQYFHLEVTESLKPKKVRKERKPMSEERRLQLSETLKKAREQRKINLTNSMV